MQGFNPFQFPLCWAFPLRLAPSQWTEHVPFALFLIEAQRPRTVMELGTHYGVSYCAFCQGIKALGLESQAYAVDTWQGDPQTGFYNSEVLADLRRHHDLLYSSFSRLIPCTFDEALAHFPDQSIDLLHIDGCHTYEAVKHDFETWLPKLSDRGLVLFHDTNVRESSFGVWRFWEEVRGRYPSFAFVHQHGLGVLAVGASYPEALRPFFDGTEDVAALREFFAQLGQRISCRLDKELTAQDLLAQVQSKDREIKEVWATRERENQELWAEIGRREQVLQNKESLLQTLTIQVAEKNGAFQELAKQLAHKEATIQEQKRQTTETEQRLKGTTDMLKETEQEAQAIAARLAARDQEAQTLQNQLTALTTSRSWRLVQLVRTATRPIRLIEKGVGKSRRAVSRAWRIWKEKGARVLLRKIARKCRLPLGGATPAVPVQDLRVLLDKPLSTWRVGKGNVLYLTGACYHPQSRITKLGVVVNGTAIPVSVHQMNRPDIFKTEYPAADPRGYSLLSGFCALVPLTACPDRTTVHLAMQARLQNGTTCLRSLGDLALVPVPEVDPWMVPGIDRRRPVRVAICMTTFNPAMELFTRQLESIKHQTNQEWICIISDDCSRPKIFEEIVQRVGADPRFHVHQNEERLGFYRNFEQCLSLVPPDVDYVALSDHDDWWQPEKLDTLLREFDDETSLVYSDMNIVDQAGKQLASTYWTNRRNNYRNLASLFLANTITGAASMFRRSLLDYLLPFPDKIGISFHDHWIGCTALTVGQIKYIDRPLYDYVQHGGNVIGHYVQPREGWLGLVLRLLATLLPVNIRGRLQAQRAQAKAIYMNDLLRIQHLAQVLQLRCAGRLPRDKQQTLHRLANLDRSARSALWLMGRGLLGLRRKSVTMGAETCLLRGLAWRRGMDLIMWLRSRRSPRAVAVPPLVAGPAEMRSRQAADVLAHGLERVEAIEQKIAPLQVQIALTAPRRVNLLIPTIDFKYVFGGYITKFNLARYLTEEGYKVRLLLVDYCDYQPVQWRQQLRAYPGLEKLLDQVEIVCAFDRSRPIAFHPRDALIATTWWTAHIAHHAAKVLNRTRFVYLIQEFETFTFPMGTYAALADQSYTLPHRAVFSTEFLRDYFRQHDLGVFAEGRELGEHHSMAFENTITAVGRITVPDIAGRLPKKLLYYARPEQHAARNMFEMGVAALTRAVKAGCFGKVWEFSGIGTVETAGRIPLGNGVVMHLLPRQSQETYREVLRAHDLGLSLMYTPHPSLVPIEMASAGMLTVTNTCGNKTANRLREISTNLIAVAPTLEGVQGGLQYAVANIENYEQRVRGAKVKWATSWDHAFHAQFMARLKEFMDEASTGDVVGGEGTRPSQAA
jgi:glycosyltransferase involved in cell wall biosynthesis